MTKDDIRKICEQKAPEIKLCVNRYIIRNPRARAYREDLLQECFEALLRKASSAKVDSGGMPSTEADAPDAATVSFGHLDCLHVCSEYYRRVMEFPKRTSDIRGLLEEYDQRFGSPLDCEARTVADPSACLEDDLLTRLDFERFVASLDPVSRWVTVERLMGRSLKEIAEANHLSKGRITQMIQAIGVQYTRFRTGNEGGRQIGQAI